MFGGGSRAAMDDHGSLLKCLGALTPGSAGRRRFGMKVFGFGKRALASASRLSRSCSTRLCLGEDDLGLMASESVGGGSLWAIEIQDSRSQAPRSLTCMPSNRLLEGGATDSWAGSAALWALASGGISGGGSRNAILLQGSRLNGSPHSSSASCACAVAFLVPREAGGESDRALRLSPLAPMGGGSLRAMEDHGSLSGAGPSNRAARDGERPGTCNPGVANSALVRGGAVSYTHLRAHETPEHLVCRLLLEKKKKTLNRDLLWRYL
eukprot:TRINITY_DN8027_c0_g1_i1.p1 TRINITY_DN8027_c0_g1~~TRINITY_DN8027_c0_g1_i1.p1  ORF type:complete len:266 (-),score=40.01 TRINITY_DN8027_c0_g1_i1:43-840(-)